MFHLHTWNHPKTGEFVIENELKMDSSPWMEFKSRFRSSNKIFLKISYEMYRNVAF